MHSVQVHWGQDDTREEKSGVRACLPRCTSPTLSAAFSPPFRLLPKEVTCSQAGPEDVFSDLRATGEWPRIVTPAASSVLQSQNCRAWHFDSGIREQRGFSFYNTDCHPGNRCDRAFFLSQWIKVSLCVSKHKPHAHSLPAHRNWVHYIFLPFFFLKVNVNEERLSL